MKHYKITCLLNESEFYTSNRIEAFNMYNKFIDDYGDWVEIYETLFDDNTRSIGLWKLIFSYNKQLLAC